MTEVQLLVTGDRFTGQSSRAAEPVIEETILSAEHEIQVAAYLFSPAATPFLELIEGMLRKGVRATIIVNRLCKQPKPIQVFLSHLASSYPYARIVDFTDNQGGELHAKVLVVDRKVAVAGSANFTWGGLVGNHEICLMVRGSTASKMASLLDRLCP